MVIFFFFFALGDIYGEILFGALLVRMLRGRWPLLIGFFDDIYGPILDGRNVKASPSTPCLFQQQKFANLLRLISFITTQHQDTKYKMRKIFTE